MPTGVGVGASAVSDPTGVVRMMPMLLLLLLLLLPLLLLVLMTLLQTGGSASSVIDGTRFPQGLLVKVIDDYLQACLELHAVHTDRYGCNLS